MKKSGLKRSYRLLINYIAGPLLFVLLSWSVYQHLHSRYTWEEVNAIFKNAFTNQHRFHFFILITLMLLNWTLEALKWRLLMQPVQRVSVLTACKAVFSGLSFSMFIPTAVGEYAGRTLYMQEGNRLRSVTLNVIGSIGQLLVTLVAGIAGLFYMKKELLFATNGVNSLSGYWLNGLMYAVLAAIIVFTFLFFNISWFTKWFEKIPFVYKHRLLVQSLEVFGWKQLTQILWLSVLRYSVFIVQYIVVFQLFNVQIDWLPAAVATAVLFLILSVIPSVPNIAELGVRGEVSRLLFGLLSANTVGIVFSAALIWIVNLIIPAIAGSLFLIGIKIFRNK